MKNVSILSFHLRYQRARIFAPAIRYHEGHCTIRMFHFDLNTLQVAGEEIVLVNKGAKPTDQPIWIEGPHLIKKDNYYYLIAAEGGTSEGHSEVVFRSRQVDGPYISSDHNPILTQRHLSSDRRHPVTTTGHADFVKTPQGDWWSVFLGCRPCFEDHFNTGREIFMAPVIWKESWPVIDVKGVTK